MQDRADDDASDEDEEPLRRARAGDRTAYSALVRRHQRAVHRHLLRMVGVSDDALELTQEVFVRAWQALPQWEPSAKFRTWLFRIASNAALDLLRRRKTIEFVPLDDAAGDAAAHPDAGPERRAQAAQELRRLEAALARLTPEHREILLLREIEDLSYEELASALALTVGTVKSRLARARAALIEESKSSRSDRP